MLTLTSEYALRATVFITQSTTDLDDSRIRGKEIADHTEIPYKYLTRILADLVRAGVLNASRGKKGGFKLTRKPQSILLYEILSPFEPVLGNRRPCPFGNLICSDDEPCAGHHQWKTVRDAYTTFLNQTSIRDVAFENGKLSLDQLVENDKVK